MSMMTAAVHPWGTPRGADNAGTTPIEIGASGTVRWSVPLPARLAHSIVASADGGWVAVGNDVSDRAVRTFLCAGDRSAVIWTRDEPCVALALVDGASSLAVARGRAGLAVLALANGDVVWARELPCSTVTVLPGAEFAVVEQHGGASRLVRLDSAGHPRWSVPAATPLGPVLARDDLSIATSKDELVAVDAGGDVIWRASPAGFGAAATPGHVFTIAPVALDRYLLVGTDAHAWRGFLLVDPDARTLEPWRLPNGVLPLDQAPVAVRRLPGHPLAVISRHMATLCDTALDGSVIHHLALRTPPVGIAVDPTGSVAVAYSDDVGYHDRYLWHDEGRALRGRSGVALIGVDGQLRWRWDAPGPVGGFAVSAEGAVLVSSEGRLWGIG
jgi:hypothetical protein